MQPGMAAVVKGHHDGTLTAEPSTEGELLVARHLKELRVLLILERGAHVVLDLAGTVVVEVSELRQLLPRLPFSTTVKASSQLGKSWPAPAHSGRHWKLHGALDLCLSPCKLQVARVRLWRGQWLRLLDCGGEAGRRRILGWRSSRRC